ncbi:hypothetical protein [Cellulomonas endophytica]|uniref:hypothetical protein n=1 Tax=Cellulomonas endophytica TaxID=2494735 RepID=UPI0010112134|nr:hypothetical protein [Cellulomonas endophytica]
MNPVEPVLPTRSPTIEQAALAVARCPEIDRARVRSSHPCRAIVQLQSPSPDRFQVPEAWAGNLQQARIAFVSSNPSISEAGDGQSGNVVERYPTASWPDARLVEFVSERFVPDQAFDAGDGFASASGRFRRNDGSGSPKRVAFWNNVRRRAAELVGQDASPVIDYVMTEVVHCKSKGEKGVASASSLCAPLHLDRVLAHCPAPLVVVLGAKARARAAEAWSLPSTFGFSTSGAWQERDHMAVLDLAGRKRLVVYLWHPTGSTAPKTFAGAYPASLALLRELVAGRISPQQVLDGLNGAVRA